MSEAGKEPVITAVSADEIPGGVQSALEGVSPAEAAAGLFDALADDESFDIEVEDEQDEEQDEESEEESDEEEGSDERPEDAEKDADLDDDDEEDESEESDDDADDDEQDEALYEVTLPGGEKAEVNLDELTAGYSRTEDYTRKRQRDAGEHAEAMTELRGVRETYDASLEHLGKILQAQGPDEPTAELRKSNPGEYAAQLAEYNQFQAAISQVGQAREVISEEQAKEFNDARQALVSEEWGQILKAVPAWSDDSIAKSELAEIRKHGIESGFTAEEIDGLTDHRLLLMFRENMALKQKKTTAKEVVEKKRRKAKKKLAPGASRRTRAAKGKKGKKAQQARDNRAAETGSVRDVAAAIETLLD